MSLRTLPILSVMEFTPEDTDRFIEMVSEQPALFNPKDMSYGDCLLKDSIWLSIAQRCNKSVPDCKKAWQYIRSWYIRSKKKNAKTGNIRKQPRHHFYKQMCFLDDIDLATKRRRPINKKSMKKSLEKLSDNPYIVGIEHVVFNKPITSNYMLNASTVKPNVQKQIAPNPKEPISPSESDELDQQKTKKIKVKKVRKVDIRNVPIAIKRSHITEQPTSNSKIHKPNETNEDTTVPLFVEYVKEVLIRLPLSLQTQAKVEIFQTLTKYQLSASNGSNNPKEVPKEDQIALTNGFSSSPSNKQIETEKNKIIKIEHDEKTKELPDVCEEIKSETNVFDEIIECKEEEMIIP